MSRKLIIEIKDEDGNLVRREESEFIVGATDSSQMIVGTLSERDIMVSLCSSISCLLSRLAMDDMNIPGMNDKNFDFLKFHENMNQSQKEVYFNLFISYLSQLTETTESTIREMLGLEDTPNADEFNVEIKHGDRVIHKDSVSHVILPGKNDVIALGNIDGMSKDDFIDNYSPSVYAVMDYFVTVLLAKCNDTRPEKIAKDLEDGNTGAIQMYRKLLFRIFENIYEMTKDQAIENQLEKDGIAIDIEEFMKQATENQINNLLNKLKDELEGNEDASE